MERAGAVPGVGRSQISVSVTLISLGEQQQRWFPALSSLYAYVPARPGKLHVLVVWINPLQSG